MGDVVFTTGILSVTASKAEIATIIGHELAHTIADHPREAMHQIQLGAYFLLPLLPIIWLGNGMVAAGRLIRQPFLISCGMILHSPMTAFGTHWLHHSRTKENEADYIGLLLMTDAGYDPAAAVTFWEEMHVREDMQLRKLQQQHGECKVRPRHEWLSTHPHVSTVTHQTTFNDELQDMANHQHGAARISRAPYPGTHPPSS